MILFIDNFDSFVYNVVQYVGEFYPDIKIFRNDEITLEEALALKPDGIIISPGPGRPEDSKVSMDLIRNCGEIPLFGVCLGHQGIAYAFGAEVIGAKNIMHGKTSTIQHTGEGVFAGMPLPFRAIRYHSLVAKPENLPDTLEVTARSEDGEIMGLRVKGRDIYGVQFHPESILTEEGKKIVKNFVDIVEQRKSEKAGAKVRSFLVRVTQAGDMEMSSAKEMIDLVMRDRVSPAQVAAYLTALSIKGETPDEIAGSAQSMFDACVKLVTKAAPLVDTCGTGGDKSSTFNISTASAFVAAGAGVYVAKHGNRSITSKSGSADVLEKLGVSVTMKPDQAARAIEQAGMAFLFAPNYHPAMKYVGPVRRDLGFRTLFNILGPIVNPAGVKHHVMGVYSSALLEKIPQVFVKLGHKHSLVVHGQGGIDEATIEGLTKIKEVRDGNIYDLSLDAADYDLSGKLSNLVVNTPEESAALIERVLRGDEKGDARKAIILNAGLVIYAAAGADLHEAFDSAAAAIDTGRAFGVLEKLRELSK